MSDERRDDEILGRALARAIETIDLNETPFERSRIAAAPARRFGFPLWQLGGVAAGLVLALAVGSWLARPAEAPGVAASPTPVLPASSGATPSPAQTLLPSSSAWVYFARDGLPPVGALVPDTRASIGSAVAAERVNTRVASLWAAAPDRVPAGATNPMRLVGRPSGSPTLSTSTQITGDVATVDFDVPSGWAVRGSAQSQALLQQLVYTITEEPGVRAALITERGKPAVIDQLVVDKPLSREDVYGYSADATDQIVSDGTRQVPAAELRLSSAYSVDTFAPGMIRFAVTVQRASGTLPDGYTPRFTANLERVSTAGSSPNDGKWRLNLIAEGTEANYTTEIVDRTPLRAVESTASGPNQTTYRLALDDARPWRAFTLQNPTRIVVDIGGAQQAVSDRVAIYTPRPGATVSRDPQITGAARVFEANVVWRLKDNAGKVVASGQFLASLGTSAVWGTFDTRIAIPGSVSGNVTLEVYEASAKDGSELGLVAIPLTVR
ncbi:MAG TPA: Gmad2 immunoglobulin-like domain-containing protein [Candidatus Limnocylindria bacterium]|jgi:hypothetical protein|nr:Gmad2 immunoglobulin-like domain-containing protein [Candidatus Limnocylindria bacterium]